MAKTTKLTVSLPVREEKLVEGATALATTAARLAAIVTQADAEAAGAFQRAVRTRIRAIKAHYKEERGSLDLAYDDIKRREARDLEPWVQADAQVGAPLLAWLSEQKRLTEEANRRRIAEAEARARADRDSQAAQVRAAAQIAGTRTEQEALERHARRIEREAPLPVKVDLEEAPTVAGIAVPEKWVAPVTNWDAFLRGVLSGKIPREAVTINQSFLDRQANALDGKLAYPGVTPEKKGHLQARGV